LLDQTHFCTGEPGARRAPTNPVTTEAFITLEHSAEELWPFVADTDRFDKAVGLPPARFQRGEVGKDEPDIGEYRMLALRVARWIEQPFEWVRYRWFSSTRDYFSGPIRKFRGGAELDPTESGTTIRVWAEFTPRNPIFTPLIRLAIAPQSMKRSCRQYQAIADFLAKKNANPFPQLVQQRTPANMDRLQAGVAEVQGKGVGAEYVQLLRTLLVDSPDEDVAGMRPLALADDYGLEPRATLEAFLHATVAGLLEMRWEMLCPGCRGAKADAAHLSELMATGHCEACNLDFEPDKDDLIEARFYPSAAVRPVDIATFCVGSPVKTPHRLMQVRLEPGRARALELELPRGSFGLRSPQTRAAAALRANERHEHTRASVMFEAEGVQPDEVDLRTGPCTVNIGNSSTRHLTVCLDESHTPVAAATPGRLMTLPAFQSLFSGEALAPGIELQVTRVGLLFSDLAGSTALYQQVGDARAFRLVTDHFAILRRAIEDAGGALIKTVGDAVMAAFPDAESALKAALSMQRHIVEIDDRGVVHPPSWLKVGVHVGPCFAVTQNEKLDYFGTAVNIAARAQHEAAGGEVVATEEAFAGAKGLFDGDSGCRQTWFTVQLKGITEPVRLARITLTEAAA